MFSYYIYIMLLRKIMMYADAVFEGGGVKGIGIAGAVCCMENSGYRFKKLAGTSAGAIIASLISAGFSGMQIMKMFLNLDYTGFMDKGFIQHIPFAGDFTELLLYKGINKGDIFENWLDNILKSRGRSKFKDVSINGESNLKIIAADITRKKLLILPDDIADYGINPMDLNIAKAVRMSISLPFYFRPVILNYKGIKCYIVDGGILSNFPVWIFDVKGTPKWPTFGFKLISKEKTYTANYNPNILEYGLDILSTMLEGIDEKYIENKDFVRTVSIPNMGVKTCEFNISRAKSLELFQAGYKSSEKFLNSWDFQRYIQRYRLYSVESRRQTLL